MLRTLCLKNTTTKPSTPSLGFLLTILSGATLVMALGCSSNLAVPPGSTGVASAQEISDCQNGCDQMKFFGCNSSTEQASCYSECNGATETQINLFVNCAHSAICDPTCRNDIAPPDPPAPTAVSSSDCASACTKAIACNFVPVGEQAACETACTQNAYQYQIDCVNNNACDAIQTACGFGSPSSGQAPGQDAGPAPDLDAGNTETPLCQQSCQILLAVMCIDAPTQSACNALCASSSESQDQTFDQCVQVSAPAPGSCTAAMACLTTFQG